MKHLLKLGLITLVTSFFIGCGGGSSSNNGDIYQETDHITQFMSDFPMLDTSGFTLTKEGRAITYYDNSSMDLSIAMNTTLVNEKDFSITGEHYADTNDFWYVYELNNPSTKGLEFAEAYISTYFYNFYDSFIDMRFEANRTISNSEFANVFGEIDADLLSGAGIYLEYEGNMSAKFANYYAEATKVGGFFDISDANVECDTDSETYWQCEKEDVSTSSYRLHFWADEISSSVNFAKGMIDW
ncbi:MAG: hypothetical protein LBJ88_03960 [Campylobacteraceae bacterium]|jgi:hypothetical protein|nr:hypothetical protein [Campylobacteraceae bacterium]